MSTNPKRKAKPKPAKREAKKPTRKKRVERKKEVTVSPEQKPERKLEPAREKPFFLAVRLIGPFGVPETVETTLQHLRLKRRFHAVLLDKNDSVLGMLRQAKDYLTWGEVGSADIAALLRDRGVAENHGRLTDKLVKEKFGQESIEKLAEAIIRRQVSLSVLRSDGVDTMFRLHPPSGGLEYSVKRPTGGRGELGFRPHGLATLIAQMT